METLKTFRHEFKYVIPYEEMLCLRKELDSVLTLDRGGAYLVRSLYFDNFNDTDYYDKLNGEMLRKKVRLRTYNPESKLAKLEIKAKNDIHQLKESLIIDKNEGQKIIKGNYDNLLLMDNPLAWKLHELFITGYRPKVIIEYDRVAYISSTTTRITFDLNVRKSNDFDNFFNQKINFYELTNKADVILEVKFDRFLEPYISKILSKYTNRYQSVSKYIMGRNVM